MTGIPAICVTERAIGPAIAHPYHRCTWWIIHQNATPVEALAITLDSVPRVEFVVGEDLCAVVDPSSRRGNFRPKALSDSWVYEYSCDPYLFDPALYYLTASDLSDTPRTLDYGDATPVMPMHPTSHLPEATLDPYNFSEILDPQPNHPSGEIPTETVTL